MYKRSYDLFLMVIHMTLKIKYVEQYINKLKTANPKATDDGVLLQVSCSIYRELTYHSLNPQTHYDLSCGLCIESCPNYMNSMHACIIMASSHTHKTRWQCMNVHCL